MSAQLKPDLYAAWKAELAGKPRGLAVGEVGAGFYAVRAPGGRQPLAIWQDDDGDMVAQVGEAEPVLVDERFCERTFSRAVAIAEGTYRRVIAGEGWPDEVALPKAVPTEVSANPHADRPNTPPAEHILIEEERAELFRSARAWLETIGGKVTTKEHADAAAKIAEKAGDLDKRAREGKRVEKKPVLDEAARLEALWKPVTENCAGTLRWSKGLVDEFLKAEAKRKADEAAAKAAQGKPVRAEDLKVKVGTGRGISLATRQDVEIDNLDEVLAHLITTPTFRDDKDVLVLARRHALTRLKNGIAVPGARIIDITGAR